jgi:hypothetical protein
MEELFEYLKHIHGLLEQIYTITDNQTTILLCETQPEEDENDSFDMLTQMADYKDEFTQELIAAENVFQQKYDECKLSLKEDKEILELKRLVQAVLERKQAIVEHEQSNLLLMQARSKKALERVYLPQNPKEAANAYKKQQKTT